MKTVCIIVVVFVSCLYGTLASAADERAVKATPAQPVVSEDLISGPPVRCWANIRDLLDTKDVSLATLSEALRAALEAEDDILIAALGKRLTALIGNDVVMAETVIHEAALEKGDVAALLLGALKDSDALQDPQVADGIIQMVETGDHEHQIAALDALESQRRLPKLALDRLTATAQGDGSTAWATVRMIGRVMTNDIEITGEYKTYFDRMFQISDQSNDPSVRYLSAEMGVYGEPRLAQIDAVKLADVVLNDEDPGVQLVAALSLTSAADSNFVLDTLEEAFQRTTERCARWTLITDATRAAGAGSLGWLQRVAATDPSFHDDRDTIAALYRDGSIEFDQVWQVVGERHPECAAWEPGGGAE